MQKRILGNDKLVVSQIGLGFLTLGESLLIFHQQFYNIFNKK